VLVKGIRSQVDVAYETPMAIVNRHLAEIETVFLLPDPAHALVSSSLVRQVAALGGDVSPFVPGRSRASSTRARAADRRPCPRGG
jgi:pantetheine-phosphate adenylyltransferase